jgi:hypothetical protein
LIRWTIVRELTTVLLVALTLVTLSLLAGCRRAPVLPNDRQRDPGVVTKIRETGDVVYVNVRRDSDGDVFTVGPFAGTPCRVGDEWPACQ